MKFAHALHGIPVLSGTSERDLLYPTPDTDQRYQDRTTGTIYTYNGSAWVVKVSGAAGGAVVLVDAFVLVGATDHLSAVNAAVVAAPSGGTIQFSPGQTYNLSALPAITKPLTINLNGATVKATGALRADVMASTDIDNVHWIGPGTIDQNLIAASGLTSYADLLAPDNISFEGRITTINAPQDDTLSHGGIRCTPATVGMRHSNAVVDVVKVKDSKTHGVKMDYVDGLTIGAVEGVDVLNHLVAPQGCTNVQIGTVKGLRIGGSCVDTSSSATGEIGSIIADSCEGDAGVSMESTCIDQTVFGYNVKNGWKAALSTNYLQALAGAAPRDLVRNIKFFAGTARAAAAKTITGATKANPCKLTVVAHGIKTITLSNTVQVSIASVAGMTQLNGTTPTVTTINPATSVHDPDALWLVGVDSSAYGTYTSGGTVAPFCAAANLYGDSAHQIQGCVVDDLEVTGYNVALTMSAANGCEARNVRAFGLQGPSSAVVRVTHFTNGKLIGLRSFDASGYPTDTLGAVQCLNQAGTSNQCDRVEIKDLFVLQSGASSNNPVLYIEGSGEFFIDGLRTGGASCFISVRAGDTPTIHLKNFSGSLSTVTPFILGAAAAPAWDIQWEQRERSLTTAGTLNYWDGHVRCDATAGAFAVTLPAASTVPGKRYTITKTDAGANAVTITPAGADTIPTITTLASQDKSFVLIARSGGWDIEAAR